MSAKDFDILVVGDLNPDLILGGDAEPLFGQVEKLVDDASLILGGSGGIFACGAARLGLRVAFVAVMGDDEFGHFLRGELVRRGVDCSGVVVDPNVKTGLCVILTRRDGDRALLTFSGSIPVLRLAQVDLGLLRRTRHLHLSSYFLLDGLRPDVPRLFAEAKSAGLSVSLDTNYDPAEEWDGGLAQALGSVDILLPNETELCALASPPGAASLRDTDAALEQLAGRVPTVAVKLGARGARARQGAQIAQAEALPVRVVDTTGAGDSFDAGFIYAHLAGWDLERSLRFASACGSLSTRAAGGTAAQATLDEALEAL